MNMKGRGIHQSRYRGPARYVDHNSLSGLGWESACISEAPLNCHVRILRSQLADSLFSELVAIRAVQQFEIWKRCHQLLDRSQRDIPIAQDVELLQRVEIGKSSELTITSLSMCSETEPGETR